MDYQLAFRYVFEKTGGFTNLLLITVCQFIPIAGPIAIMGYEGEVAVALDRDPKLRRHPKFDFKYFAEYLSNGVWPFLIGLIISIPFVLILFTAFFIGLAIDPPGPNNPPLVALVIAASVYPIAVIAFMAFSVPMTFHAKFTAKFDLGGALRFTMAFLKLVGGKAFVVGVVFTFLSTIVVVIGLLCCFVGIYPANVLIQMAAQHLMVQLYQEYLHRGGKPLDDEGDLDHKSDREDDYRDEHRHPDGNDTW